MAGVFGLVGGEEFRVGCEEMDREIMKASGQDPSRVVVIPTAAVTGPAKAANDGVRHFSGLGGNASRLMVLEREHAEDEDPAVTAEHIGSAVLRGRLFLIGFSLVALPLIAALIWALIWSPPMIWMMPMAGSTIAKIFPFPTQPCPMAVRQRYKVCCTVPLTRPLNWTFLSMRPVIYQILVRGNLS